MDFANRFADDLRHAFDIRRCHVLMTRELEHRVPELIDFGEFTRSARELARQPEKHGLDTPHIKMPP